MEKIIHDSVCSICLLIGFIFLLKFVQNVWFKYRDISAAKKIEEQRNTHQLAVFDKKIQILDKEEEIRKCERPHEVQLKEKEIDLKQKEIELKQLAK